MSIRRSTLAQSIYFCDFNHTTNTDSYSSVNSKLIPGGFQSSSSSTPGNSRIDRNSVMKAMIRKNSADDFSTGRDSLDDNLLIGSFSYDVDRDKQPLMQEKHGVSARFPQDHLKRHQSSDDYSQLQT
eukprot:gene42785-53085_t